MTHCFSPGAQNQLAAKHIPREPHFSPCPTGVCPPLPQPNTPRHFNSLQNGFRRPQTAPTWLPPQVTQLPQLKIYNSLTRTEDDFIPLDPAGKVVTWYACGPTIYEDGHAKGKKKKKKLHLDRLPPAHHARLLWLPRQVRHEHHRNRRQDHP